MGPWGACRVRARDLWRRLAVTALRRAEAPALDDLRGRRVAWGDLLPAVADAAGVLRRSGTTRLGLLADNGIDWALADLGALALGITLVPVPGFFSAAQQRHVLERAAVDALLTDDPDRAAAAWPRGASRSGNLGALTLLGLTPRSDDGRCPGCVSPGGPVAAASPPARVTFTSGTTGAPKGVRLSEPAVLRVAESLATTTGADPQLRHLCTLPLAILLEDVGGLWRTLIGGGCVLLPSLTEVGLGGSSDLDPERLARTLGGSGAGSAILMPEMLNGLVDVLASGAQPAPTALHFVGVGGAPVDVDVQQRAEGLGLPVFEGYGLSEAASVVALNSLRARRLGSVGRPLPHVTVRIAGDGEIRVGGALFDGYLPGPEGEGLPMGPDADGLWGTGDLGHLDADGFLHVHGRRDALLVTSFGRNVQPDWIERELRGLPGVLQAAVVGEAQPGLLAVLVTADGVPPTPAQMAQLNAGLPDYARVVRWLVGDEPFSAANGLLAGDGQPCRDAIGRLHAARWGAAGCVSTAASASRPVPASPLPPLPPGARP